MHLYSAVEFEDTEVLSSTRLKEIK